MAGRYEKVFSLPENLYAAGSPVIIAAGALQKDTRTGKIFAQLKLQSISSGIIKAAAIQISLFDTASRPLSNQVEYQYLDVEISSSQTFGEKILIPVEDNTARSFSVAVTEVVFADQRIWKDSDESWEPLPAAAELRPILHDLELLEQYQLRFGRRHMYQFTEAKDLWRCSCGAWNHKSNEKCLSCETLHADLASLDWEELKAEKNARLMQKEAERAKIEAEKARIAEEKAQQEAAKKKKIRKFVKKFTLVIISIAVVSFSAIFCIKSHQKAVFQTVTSGVKSGVKSCYQCYQNLFQKERYDLAMSMFDDGKYSDALPVFADLNDYKDSYIYEKLLRWITRPSYSFTEYLKINSVNYDYKSKKVNIDTILIDYPFKYPNGRFDPLPKDIDFINEFLSITHKVDNVSNYAYLSSDMPDVECTINIRADEDNKTLLYTSCNGKSSFSIADKDALIGQQEKLKNELENSISNFCGTYRKADGEKNYFLLNITSNSFELSRNQPRLDGTIHTDVLEHSACSWYVSNGIAYAEVKMRYDSLRLTPDQNTILVKSSFSHDMSEKNEFYYGIYTKIS